MKNKAAQQLGRLGGKATTSAKAAAARANGAKGGRPRKAILGRRRSTIPGDTEMVLLREAVDSDGRIWRSGSIYQPLSIGAGYQTVSIREAKEDSVFNKATFRTS